MNDGETSKLSTSWLEEITDMGNTSRSGIIEIGTSFKNGKVTEIGEDQLNRDSETGEKQG